jgi:hypothetical protein
MPGREASIASLPPVDAPADGPPPNPLVTRSSGVATYRDDDEGDAGDAGNERDEGDAGDAGETSALGER